ncbi:MAG: universal stress protein [Gemmatimonadales bacterium]
MVINHIVVATDESDAGRQAVRTAVAVAARTGARVTVMRAVAASGAVLSGVPRVESVADEAAESSVERLRRWVGDDAPAWEDASIEHAPPVSFAVTYGLPGVEIGRFAERERADLLVLGRKPRSRMARLVVGDTADAVARRSLLPCLFVPGPGALPRTVLVAVDGTERGMAVFTAGVQFALQIGAELHFVTVEPRRPDERADSAAAVPTARSIQLSAQVRSVEGGHLEVRRGAAVEEILAAAHERRPDVLVIGCHRGGPPGIIDAGSTARRLAHTASCATLTVPL